MNNISPIGGGPSPISAGRTGRSAKALIPESGKAPSEVTNGERNARATAAEAKRQNTSAPTTNQDGRGGNLDIVS
ncbi:MAG: hypothetical protein KDB07_10070 [Planctomycetes bacterium]|nr:hypothetical protein [Planctomycetota bacterium]